MGHLAWKCFSNKPFASKITACPRKYLFKKVEKQRKIMKTLLGHMCILPFCRNADVKIMGDDTVNTNSSHLSNSVKNESPLINGTSQTSL